MALQVFNGFQRVHAEQFVGSVVRWPCSASLTGAGRPDGEPAGRSSMAAEIGRCASRTDRRPEGAGNGSEQYLFVPRVIAGIVMLPFWSCSRRPRHLRRLHRRRETAEREPGRLRTETYHFLEMNDIGSGVIKAAVFGMILTLTAACAATTRPAARKASGSDDVRGGVGLTDHSLERFLFDEDPF